MNQAADHEPHDEAFVLDPGKIGVMLPKALDAIGIGLAVVDQGGRVVEVNLSFCRFLGYRNEELRGLATSAFTHPGDVAATAAAYDRVWSGSESLVWLEKRYLRRDASVVWGRLAIAVVPDRREPRRRLAVITCEDVTRRRELEAKLQGVAAALAGVVLPAARTGREERIEAKLACLSRREAEVVRLLTANRRVPSIAQALGVNPRTVRNHLLSAYRKLGVHSQAALLEFLASD